ncbi:MAG: hypothetical protein KGK01_14030 [Bradyrhizobium sp.]|uniref:hypothetical protein n=1 Tax=Bradyrhizobium sp. TaxID=376 RepID=UPI001C29790C|nr:hypothetical protein [Bradyrhizobium sp.]MBU6461816.1 hypothetical protein [Pseudomonadota bacterium]MDE2066137.1 hypothetical protein [Bradyrhizobium sp.]MDE2243500.1 hypothetical protein [Bradyrhizobium sp.]MDE2468971.1 hypothetical protein [Bradyrhizobium sp.]
MVPFGNRFDKALVSLARRAAGDGGSRPGELENPPPLGTAGAFFKILRFGAKKTALEGYRGRLKVRNALG